MRYYDILNQEAFDAELFEKYTIKHNPQANVSMIAFEDNDLPDIRRIINLKNMLKNNLNYYCYDDARNLYELTNETVKRVGKGKYSLAHIYAAECRQWKKIRRQRETMTKQLSHYTQNGIAAQKGPGVRYRPYIYADKENHMLVPFRFKKTNPCKKLPLFVYFHGADAMGTDNIRPFLDFLPLAHSLKKYNCGVLIPQAPVGINLNDCSLTFKQYCTAIKNLIQTLINTGEVDENRIYITGSSLGGACVWEMLLRYPTLLACAMPVMGSLSSLWNKHPIDFQKIKNVPVWIAHSTNDKIVSINDDDYCARRLLELDADVKYTRWEKYGHTMFFKFYRQEPWAEWMFRQDSRKRRQKDTSSQ